MPDTPHDIQFPLADFDRSELPEGERELQGDAYLQAIREHLAGQFVNQGGAAEVAVTHDRVIIRWKETGKPESLAELGANLLTQGDTAKGIATLRLALKRDPNDAAALFNLGMGLDDPEQAGEALELLQRLVDIAPAYPGAWVRLGCGAGTQPAMGRRDQIVQGSRVPLSAGRVRPQEPRSSVVPDRAARRSPGTPQGRGRASPVRRRGLAEPRHEPGAVRGDGGG